MSANISESMTIRQGPALRVIVEVTNGPYSGRKAWLRAGQVLKIGRTERADFTVPHDKNMSGLHFTLECERDVCRVRDAESANGTSVNGEKVTESFLKHGDEIAAGSTKFKINIEGSREVTADESGSRTVRLTGDLGLPKHAGPAPSKQPPLFRERTCLTGLVALEGTAPEPTPAQVAQILWKLGTMHLIVDYNRMALAPPEELTAPEYIYDWLPPEIVGEHSPVLLSPSDPVDPYGVIGSTWGQAGLVVLFSKWERPKLLDHLRGVIRGKTRADGRVARNAMLGICWICWPDLLGSMLRDSLAGSRDYLFSAFEAVLLEGAEPMPWQVLVRPATLSSCLKIGFVKASEVEPPPPGGPGPAAAP
jgi:pSer/pThr/pTyr-binding forkhead associated (FHA) protein